MQVSDTNNYVTVDGCVHHNSGKTTGIFFKLAYMASLQEPDAQGIRKTRAVIVRNTMPQLKDTTLVSWSYWFKEGVAGTWNATDKIFTLKFGDVECEVLFRPLDTADDVRRVLSLEVSFAVFDEFVEIDEAIIRAMRARVGRYPGNCTNWGIWGSSNPGNEDDWWHDYLKIDAPEKRPPSMKYFEQPSGFSEDAENTEHLPGGTDYYIALSEEEDEDGEKKSEAWVKRFIEVQWGFSLSGKPVVPTFNLQVHRSPKPLKPLWGIPIVIGYDPGIGGSALIFTQEDLDGRLLILDELTQRGYGTDRLITDRLIPLLNAKYAGYEILIAPDPAADSRTSTDEKTSVKVLKAKARIPGRPDEKRWRVVFPTMDNRLQGRLDAIEHYTTRLTIKGPAMLVDPGCRAVLRALNGGWAYSTDKKGETADMPAKNQWSHPGDATSYAARYYHLTGVRTHKRRTRSSDHRQGNSYAAR